MMRAIALVSLLVLAACSDNTGADEKAKADAEAEAQANLKLAPGQWETTTEIANVESQDGGTPVMKTGRTVTSACISEAEGKKPNPAVIAGMEGADCAYDNMYMSGGRLNASISCNKPGLSGKTALSAEGSYTAESFDANATFQTYLATDGDVKATGKITGRRTGDCPAAS